MPILYIHGVATRSRDGFVEIERYLRRLVAPAISLEPDSVLIDDVFWGDVAATFFWDGASRPKSRLLGMGAEGPQIPAVENVLTATAFANALARLPATPTPAPATGGLIAGGAAPTPTGRTPLRLKDLSPDALSDLLVVLVGNTVADSAQRAPLNLAADAVAHDPATLAALAGVSNTAQEIDILLARVQARAATDAALVGMGAPTWLAGVRDRLGEALSRAVGLPAYTVSVVAAELRKPLNEFISVFLGDVFTYLRTRGTAAEPGVIPQRLLDKLTQAHQNKQARGGEPLVVLSHSMGGQIVYDALTHFLPGTPALHDIRIDFWCATASQVGFFEETKLLLASMPAYHTGHPVPFPRAHLGGWWNVWDHNDFLSFTADGIIAQVDDSSFDSGMPLLTAHSGYLQRPSFYRALATRLQAAAGQGWRTI
jgi:hypothetical protein